MLSGTVSGMKKRIITIFMLAAAAAAKAHEGPTFNLKDPTIRPGSTARNDWATGSDIPFDKGYRELTQEQQAPRQIRQGLPGARARDSEGSGLHPVE